MFFQPTAAASIELGELARRLDAQRSASVPLLRPAVTSAPLLACPAECSLSPTFKTIQESRPDPHRIPQWQASACGVKVVRESDACHEGSDRRRPGAPGPILEARPVGVALHG